jgi:hypothetical protein
VQLDVVINEKQQTRRSWDLFHASIPFCGEASSKNHRPTAFVQTIHIRGFINHDKDTFRPVTLAQQRLNGGASDLNVRVLQRPSRHPDHLGGGIDNAAGSKLDLNDDELGKLRAAAEGIREKCADLAKL